MAYDPKSAKDAERAKSLAASFRDNTAKKTIQQIAADPANQPAIKAFQDAAGIGVDGKVGPNTLAAYSYYSGVKVAAPASAPAPRVTQAMVAPAPAPKSRIPVPVIALGVAAALGIGWVVWEYA